ncbi:hypothetical protein AB0942_26985 [Streptomyces nodosus]|uniref:hypothetical protein n=1 Tax=Streptomyces nodosus TaxID=40318 RepID=UPI00345677CD
MASNFVNLVSEPPHDLPLSPKVKSLRKAWQDAEEKLTKYRQENSRYITIDVSEIWESKARHSYRALEDAKRELRQLEIAAVAEGKALPNKEVYLGTVKAKKDEVDRTVPALKTLALRSKEEYAQAVYEDLHKMGRVEAKKAYEARLAWEKAYNAMLAAKATLNRHATLFTWCVSAGGWNEFPTHGNSQGENLEAWELTDDGRLTYEASLALDYVDSSAFSHSLIKVEGLVEPDPNPPAPVEEKEIKPRYWNAKEDILDYDARMYFG